MAHWGAVARNKKKKKPKNSSVPGSVQSSVVHVAEMLRCFQVMKFSVVHAYCYFGAISHILIFEELIFKTYNTLFRQQLGIFTEDRGINRCTKENRNYVTYRFVSTRHLTAVVVPSWRT